MFPARAPIPENARVGHKVRVLRHYIIQDCFEVVGCDTLNMARVNTATALDYREHSLLVFKRAYHIFRALSRLED
jgi:hypothetical protein